MSLTLVFRTVTIFFIITPVLADDKASEQEITPKMAELLQFQDWYTQGNTKNDGGLANLQIASRRFAPCICGLSSFKCCRRKRTIAKIKEAENISAARN